MERQEKLPMDPMRAIRLWRRWPLSRVISKLALRIYLETRPAYALDTVKARGLWWSLNWTPLACTLGMGGSKAEAEAEVGVTSQERRKK